MGKDCMKDLLKRFKETTNQEEESELNLGLSLGGCFGVKPRPSNSGGGTSLFRSASSSEACLTAAFTKAEVDDVPPLVRTSSLPSRKRKGLELMGEMEINKKRSGEDWSFNPNWGFNAQGQGHSLLTTSHASIGSLGSASSANSSLENQSAQGSSNHCGSRSPASVLPLPEQMERKPAVMSFSEPNTDADMPVKPKKADQSEKPKVMNSCTKEADAKVMEDMPCVFTKGDGPNGKRIEGLLFKYKKGEEVRIVCVCHGTFLTPAEFVKHAGGGEVAHPLRHIVVVTPVSSFS